MWYDQKLLEAFWADRIFTRLGYEVTYYHRIIGNLVGACSWIHQIMADGYGGDEFTRV